MMGVGLLIFLDPEVVVGCGMVHIDLLPYQINSCPNTLAHLVELVDGCTAEIDPCSESEDVQVRQHIREFLAQFLTLFVEGEIAPLDLLDEVGSFAEFPTNRVGPGAECPVRTIGFRVCRLPFTIFELGKTCYIGLTEASGIEMGYIVPTDTSIFGCVTHHVSTPLPSSCAA